MSKSPVFLNERSSTPQHDSIKFDNGDHYMGYILNGLAHGHGVIICADGTTYRGEWAFGEKHGTGIMKTKDGHTLKGQWLNGELKTTLEPIVPGFTDHEYDKPMVESESLIDIYLRIPSDETLPEDDFCNMEIPSLEPIPHNHTLLSPPVSKEKASSPRTINSKPKHNTPKQSPKNCIHIIKSPPSPTHLNKTPRNRHSPKPPNSPKLNANKPFVASLKPTHSNHSPTPKPSPSPKKVKTSSAASTPVSLRSPIQSPLYSPMSSRSASPSPTPPPEHIITRPNPKRPASPSATQHIITRPNPKRPTSPSAIITRPNPKRPASPTSNNPQTPIKQLLVPSPSSLLTPKSNTFTKHDETQLTGENSRVDQQLSPNLCLSVDISSISTSPLDNLNETSSTSVDTSLPTALSEPLPIFNVTPQNENQEPSPPDDIDLALTLNSHQSAQTIEANETYTHQETDDLAYNPMPVTVVVNENENETQLNSNESLAPHENDNDPIVEEPQPHIVGDNEPQQPPETHENPQNPIYDDDDIEKGMDINSPTLPDTNQNPDDRESPIVDNEQIDGSLLTKENSFRPLARDPSMDQNNSTITSDQVTFKSPRIIESSSPFEVHEDILKDRRKRLSQCKSQVRHLQQYIQKLQEENSIQGAVTSMQASLHKGAKTIKSNIESPQIDYIKTSPCSSLEDLPSVENEISKYETVIAQLHETIIKLQEENAAQRCIIPVQQPSKVNEQQTSRRRWWNRR